MSEQTMSIEIRKEATRAHITSPSKLFVFEEVFFRSFVTSFVAFLLLVEQSYLSVFFLWFCFFIGSQLFTGDSEFV